MNDSPDKLAKYGKLRWSMMAALFVFLTATVFNKSHPFDFSLPSLATGAAFAVVTVVALQLAARLDGQARRYGLLALASAVLFYFLCWDAVFNNEDGRYSLAIALSLWLGFTAGGFALFAIYGRDPASPK